MMILTIAKREVRSMFATSMGWMVLCGFLFLIGVWWIDYLRWYSQASTDIIENPYATDQADLSSWLLAPFFQQGMSFILAMMCPAIAMRLFSDELKSKSIELLFTSPISTLEIVIGKYLGALGFVAIMLAGTATVPVSLYFFAKPDWGVVAGGYLAAFLTCATTIAIGMLYSASTQNAIVALILGFSTSMSLWLLPYMSQDPEAILKKVCMVDHLESFSNGTIALADATWFATVIGFFVFATWQRVEGHRWR